jgi:hypothetical protein
VLGQRIRTAGSGIVQGLNAGDLAGDTLAAACMDPRTDGILDFQKMLSSAPIEFSKETQVFCDLYLSVIELKHSRDSAG